MTRERVSQNRDEFQPSVPGVCIEGVFQRFPGALNAKSTCECWGLGEHNELVYQELRNGARLYRVHCTNCEGTCGYNIPHSKLTDDEKARARILNPEAYHGPCDHCGERGAIELHHTAPRAVFGRDCDAWPIVCLCRECHALWHSAIASHYSEAGARKARIKAARQTKVEAGGSGTWRDAYREILANARLQSEPDGAFQFYDSMSCWCYEELLGTGLLPDPKHRIDGSPRDSLTATYIHQVQSEPDPTIRGILASQAVAALSAGWAPLWHIHGAIGRPEKIEEMLVYAAEDFSLLVREVQCIRASAGGSE